MRSGTDTGSKILDSLDMVVGQQFLTEARQIQPFVRSAFQRAVIEVKSVDVDDRLRHRSSKLLTMSARGRILSLFLSPLFLREQGAKPTFGSASVF